MPSNSHHYTSTNSVSSLSLSSMSSLYSSHVESDESPDNSQQTTLTSWSRMDRRRAATASKSRYHDARGSPSPLLQASEDEAGDEDDDEHGQSLARRTTVVRRNQVHQREWPRSTRSSIEPATRHVEHAPFRPSHSSPPPAYESGSRPAGEEPHQLPRGATPSTPKTFAQLFPKTCPLNISHPSTEDGNLNLQVNVLTGNQSAVTLFHLRMHNLKAREFSLRRYSRDSGREICKSTRRQRRMSGTVEALEKAEKKREKEAKKEEARRKSFTTSDRGKGKLPLVVDTGSTRSSQQPILHQSPRTPESYSSKSPAALRRLDSGYASGSSDSPSPSLRTAVTEARNGCLRDSGLEHLEEEPNSMEPDAFEAAFTHFEEIGIEDEAADAEIESAIQNTYLRKDVLKLNFSNYAHLDMKRRGTVATGKRYEYEYWGVNYVWKRVVQIPNISGSDPRRRHCEGAPENQQQQGPSNMTIEYHLFQANKPEPIATIVPKELSPHEAERESELGGWVVPSTMLIKNEHVLKAPNASDVCEVIVATGLLALTDDCIRTRWNESSGFLDRIAKLAPSMSMSMPRRWSKVDMSGLIPRRLSIGRKC